MTVFWVKHFAQAKRFKPSGRLTVEGLANGECVFGYFAQAKSN